MSRYDYRQLQPRNFIIVLTFLFSKFLTFFSIAVKHIFRGVSVSGAAIFRSVERDVFISSILPVRDSYE